MQSEQRAAIWLWLGPVLGALVFIFGFGLVLYLGRLFALIFDSSFRTLFYSVVGLLVFALFLASFVVLRSGARRGWAITGGYVAACLVTGFALVTMEFVSRLSIPKNWGLRQPTVPDIIGAGFVAAGFAFVLMLLPVSLAIWYAERSSRRSPLYYGIIGAIVAAPMSAFLSKGLYAPSPWWIVAIGALAGLTYWAIAGRKAGGWRSE